MILRTQRLRLRPLQPSDADALAALHADAEVMADAGRPLGREKSDVKLARYVRHFQSRGFGHWAVFYKGEFAGYVGVAAVAAEHPLGAHHSAGWRLVRRAWSLGLAAEAARAVLDDAVGRVGLREVLAYTGPDNARSKALMARLGLARRIDLDFALDEGRRISHWLTWEAGRSC